MASGQPRGPRSPVGRSLVSGSLGASGLANCDVVKGRSVGAVMGRKITIVPAMLGERVVVQNGKTTARLTALLPTTTRYPKTTAGTLVTSGPARPSDMAGAAEGSIQKAEGLGSSMRSPESARPQTEGPKSNKIALDTPSTRDPIGSRAIRSDRGPIGSRVVSGGVSSIGLSGSSFLITKNHIGHKLGEFVPTVVPAVYRKKAGR